MSNYGPPGGPYPGRGRDPQEEPYTEPSDPWGDWGRDDNAGGGYAQGPDYPQGSDYPQGGYDQQGYGQQHGYGNGGYDVTGTGYAQRPAEAAPGGWAPSPPAQPGPPVPQPAPPARKGGSGMLILVAVLVLLVLAGGGTAFYLLTQTGDDTNTTATGDPTPQPVDSGSPAPSAGGEASPNPSASAPLVSDARDVKKGECVQNVGDGAKPVMKIADCDEKSVYEVLARFDSPATGEDDAKKKCEAVEGYTNWYFFNSQLDSLDFVLCLKQR
ncbi:hypothetical protein J2S43_007056 [Catenuloplanes nepalensis]|uniref:Flagellar basal body protein FliL n=1 Tax=Catenuloplanes nepalensis TaxID=587533 RepID=A0ABT9N4B5_9ACTN|nr:hypothetical protein [Catenuloplanes nepalensis]MDP9798544.1 hypothetical protein [Catenuloplanes nepalensis]